jgi:ComF family protein
MKKLARNISDLVDLFFPKLCITCGERLISQENYLCINCWLDLPVTNFHKNPDNKVAQLFWGRVEIENATSFFGYKSGSRYRELIHFIKYKGLKELGFETGRRFGLALAQVEEFSNIDVVVPVPLHKRKLKKRGFNQSDWIAAGIAEALKKPVSTDNLFRHVYTQTQTKKNRFERFVNVEGIFAIKNLHKFEGKHILLIDDVVTTGSTLEACAVELLKLSGTKVSIATLAFADY